MTDQDRPMAETKVNRYLFDACTPKHDGCSGGWETPGIVRNECICSCHRPMAKTDFSNHNHLGGFSSKCPNCNPVAETDAGVKGPERVWIDKLAYALRKAKERGGGNYYFSSDSQSIGYHRDACRVDAATELAEAKAEIERLNKELQSLHNYELGLEQ